MNKPQAIRYGKPCLTNLPPKLGRKIFEAILSSPRVCEKKRRDADRKFISRFEERLKKRIEKLKAEGKYIPQP